MRTNKQALLNFATKTDARRATWTALRNGLWGQGGGWAGICWAGICLPGKLVRVVVPVVRHAGQQNKVSVVSRVVSENCIRSDAGVGCGLDVVLEEGPAWRGSEGL